MLAVTALAVLTLPFALPVLAAADLARGRTELPLARVHLFSLQYLVNDTVEILVSPLLWLLAGAGRTLDRRRSVDRHLAVQRWSIEMLMVRARQLLGVTIDLGDALDVMAARPGPVVMISRHVSIFDSSIPALVADRAGRRTRGVVMAEMLNDPGFDVIYQRTGSVFIPRDDPSNALAAIEAMTAGADDRSAFVIFPEGRLWRPAVLRRRLNDLAAADAARAKRLASLEHLLPPRPGGLFALLDSLPGADLVVVDHRGLDNCRTLSELTRRIPFEAPVTVSARRIPRSDIPDDRDERMQWLDELWLDWDRAL